MLPRGTSDAEIETRTREERFGDGFFRAFDFPSGASTPPSPREGEHLVVAFQPNDPYNGLRGEKHGVSADEYAERGLAWTLRSCRELGERFLWTIGWETFDPQHWCNDDGSAMRFSNRKAAFEFYRRWVRTSLHTKHWRNSLKFGEHRRHGRPCVIETLERRGLRLEDCRLALGSVCASHAHYALEVMPEAKAVWWECAISLLNLQVGFCFVRGAARQYGKRWVADVSPHCYPYPVHPDEYYANLGEWGELEGRKRGLVRPRLNLPKYTSEMVRLAGYTPEMLARCWFAALMSGADYLLEESSSVTHFVQRGNRLDLTPVGRLGARLADFNRRLEDRGRTQAPVALHLDFYHGVEPWLLEKPWGYCETEIGDAQITGFFKTAYPGHSEWPEAHPWRNDREHGDMLRSGFDFRPYERRVLCAGRWPDMFDVYLSNATPPAFADSKAILMLGGQRADASRQAILRTLVDHGRALVADIGQLERGGPLSEGVVVGAETREHFALVDPSGKWMPEAPFTCHAVEASADWEVALSTSEGVPALLRRRFGKGEVWLWTVPFGMDGGRQPLRAWVALLDRLFAPLLPFAFDGPPIQRIVNRTAKGWLVAMLNHSARPWQGFVRYRSEAPHRVRERWLDQPAVWSPVLDGADIRAAVPPFAFRAYEIE